jgi:hypothetical protein
VSADISDEGWELALQITFVGEIRGAAGNGHMT